MAPLEFSATPRRALLRRSSSATKAEQPWLPEEAGEGRTG